MPAAYVDEKLLPPLAIRPRLRWAVVEPILQQLAPRRTVEVGVGAGAMGARIAARSSESYVAYETDEQSYRQAAHRVAPYGGVVHHLPLESAPPEPCDLLCAFEVLEHIDDDAGALGAWARYVEPGGHLLVSVPCNPARFGPMDVHAGHFRRYTEQGLRDLVEGAGFTDVRITPYGAPLGYALEAVRNRVDARKLARKGDASVAELTGASGRTFQFDRASWKSTAVGLATAPFAAMQRVWPGGIGFVAVADKR